MRMHPNARVVNQPVCLSSFHVREPTQYARLQQFLRPTKDQARQFRCGRQHGSCTCAAQSMVDALGGKAQPAPQRAWWNDHQELWAAVHSPEELDKELEGNTKDMVVVGGPHDCSVLFQHALWLSDCKFHADFYGTWCVGCAKVYPEVCRVAADATLRKRCHFVKVCSCDLAKLQRC